MWYFLCIFFGSIRLKIFLRESRQERQREKYKEKQSRRNTTLLKHLWDSSVGALFDIQEI